MPVFTFLLFLIKQCRGLITPEVFTEIPVKTLHVFLPVLVMKIAK